MPKKEKKPSLISLSKIAEDPNTASPERPLCQTCGLFKQTTNPFLNPKPNPKWTGKLLLIGEAPGEDEERTGRFFVGRAGKLLNELLARNSFGCASTSASTDVEIWNAVRCRPRNNATPTMAQIRCCRPYVLDRCNRLNPKVILALGTVALRSVLNSGDVTVTKTRGRPLTLPEEQNAQVAEGSNQDSA